MDPIAGELRGVTLAKVVKWVCATVMIFGGVVPYIPQYREIYLKEDAEGFSMYVCLALLIANTLRILFWFGKRYELPLLLQSIIMNILMLAMIHLCVRVRNKHNLVSMRGQEKYFTEEEEDLATLGYDLADNVTASNMTTVTFLDNSLQTSDERSEKNLVCRVPSLDRTCEKTSNAKLNTTEALGRVTKIEDPENKVEISEEKIADTAETRIPAFGIKFDSSNQIEINDDTVAKVTEIVQKTSVPCNAILITLGESSIVFPNENDAVVGPSSENGAVVGTTTVFGTTVENLTFVAPTREKNDINYPNNAPKADRRTESPEQLVESITETIIGVDNSSPSFLKRRPVAVNSVTDKEFFVAFSSNQKELNRMFRRVPWIPFSSFRDKSLRTYFDWRYFWQWTDFQSYLDFLLALSISLSLLTFLCINSTLFIECLGFMAVFTEAMLGVPQLLKNLRSRSTEGMSILMVLMWTAGDAFKTVYFVVREAPLQFWICGTLQVLIDITILGQVYWYRTNTAPPGTRSDRVD